MNERKKKPFKFNESIRPRHSKRIREPFIVEMRTRRANVFE